MKIRRKIGQIQEIVWLKVLRIRRNLKRSKLRIIQISTKERIKACKKGNKSRIIMISHKMRSKSTFSRLLPQDTKYPPLSLINKYSAVKDST